MSNQTGSQNSSTWRWLAVTGWLALLVTVLLQWRFISKLRQENNSLRAQSQAAAPPNAKSPPVPSAAAESIDVEQAQKDTAELLRLRNEVRQLRQQTSPPPAQAQAGTLQPATSAASAGQSVADEARQLVGAAMGGDLSPLDKLAKLMTGIMSMKADERPAGAMAGIRSAFDLLGTEAGNGNAAALQALWQASRIQSLQGLAVQGLGRAAGLGNEAALKPLLDPEAYFLLRSSAVAGLKPAADAGNERAIQALAVTAADEKQQALWLLAAQGLQTAASGGNATAIDGLAMIAASTNQMISKEAVQALEAAARNRQPRAEEALRKLGWR